MLDVRRVGSDLQVSGELDDVGGRALLEAVTRVKGDVSVDASGLRRIDGAGLTALAIARQRCRSEGREFALTALAASAAQGLRTERDLPSLFAPRANATTDAGATSAPHDGDAPQSSHATRWRALPGRWFARGDRFRPDGE
jgi:anti-anti-sigma regulatory factor